MSFSARLVETCGVSRAGVAMAVMVMVSLVIGGNAASRRVVWESRRMVSLRMDAKCSWTNVTRYAPGGNAASSYAPESPVTTLRVPCRAGDETVTVTPESGAPAAVTLPVSDADVCANTEDAHASDSAAATSRDGSMELRERLRVYHDLAEVRRTRRVRGALRQEWDEWRPSSAASR